MEEGHPLRGRGGVWDAVQLGLDELPVFLCIGPPEVGEGGGARKRRRIRDRKGDKDGEVVRGKGDSTAPGYRGSEVGRTEGDIRGGGRLVSGTGKAGMGGPIQKDHGTIRH